MYFLEKVNCFFKTQQIFVMNHATDFTNYINNMAAQHVGADPCVRPNNMAAQHVGIDPYVPPTKQTSVADAGTSVAELRQTHGSAPTWIPKRNAQNKKGGLALLFTL